MVIQICICCKIVYIFVIFTIIWICRCSEFIDSCCIVDSLILGFLFYGQVRSHKPAIQKIMCLWRHFVCPVVISELRFGETKGLQSFVYKYN